VNVTFLMCTLVPDGSIPSVFKGKVGNPRAQSKWPWSIRSFFYA